MSPSVPTIVITGATSGIGRCAAIELARRGANLVLTARSQPKADTTVAMIKAAAPDTQVDVHYGDFTDLASVAALGRQIVARHTRIDTLINNAGIHAFKPRVTADGYSEMVGVNYLAPWLFTDILREKLVASTPSRVVTVASEASRHSGQLNPKVDLFKTEPFSRIGSSRIYGQTKLMDIMFSMELARQLDRTGVAVNCLDPGFNVTGLGRELSFAAPLERILSWLKIGNPRRGAGIIVRLATDPAFTTVSGGYFSFNMAKPLTPVAPADDSRARMDLWKITAQTLVNG